MRQRNPTGHRMSPCSEEILAAAATRIDIDRPRLVIRRRENRKSRIIRRKTMRNHAS
jgi:hypothetical protein